MNHSLIVNDLTDSDQETSKSDSDIDNRMNEVRFDVRTHTFFPFSAIADLHSFKLRFWPFNSNTT